MALENDKQNDLRQRFSEWIDTADDPSKASSNPMYTGIGSFLEQFTDPAERAQAKESIKKQWVEPLVAAADKGGNYKSITESGGNQESSGMLSWVLGLAGSLIGGPVQFIIDKLASLPILEDLLASFTDQRDPAVKDAESAAAGVFNGFKPISVLNRPLDLEASQKFVIMEAVKMEFIGGENNESRVASTQPAQEQLSSEDTRKKEAFDAAVKALNTNNDNELSSAELKAKDKNGNGELSLDELDNNKDLFDAILKASGQNGNSIKFSDEKTFTPPTIPNLMKAQHSK